MREVNEALGKRQDNQVDRLNIEQTANLMKLVEGLDALHHKFYQDSKRAAIDIQKIMLDRTNDALQEIRSEYLKEARLIRKNVENTQGIILATSKLMEDMQDKFNVLQENFLESQASAREQMKTSISEVDTVAKVSIKEIDGTMKEIRSAIECIKKAQEDNIKNFASLMAETTEQLLNMVARLEEWQKDDRRSHREALKDISITLTKAQTELAKSSLDTAKAIEDMSKEIAALAGKKDEEAVSEENMFTAIKSMFGDKK